MLKLIWNLKVSPEVIPSSLAIVKRDRHWTASILMFSVRQMASLAFRVCFKMAFHATTS